MDTVLVRNLGSAALDIFVTHSEGKASTAVVSRTRPHVLLDSLLFLLFSRNAY